MKYIAFGLSEASSCMCPTFKRKHLIWSCRIVDQTTHYGEWFYFHWLRETSLSFCSETYLPLPSGVSPFVFSVSLLHERIFIKLSRYTRHGIPRLLLIPRIMRGGRLRSRRSISCFRLFFIIFVTKKFLVFLFIRKEGLNRSDKRYGYYILIPGTWFSNTITYTL